VIFFNKRKPSDDEAADASQPKPDKGKAQPVKSDPKHSRPWFDRAQTVADARNYDYAVQCYISGLQFEPDNLSQHEALRDVAMRRKVAGGKPAGMFAKTPVSGKGPVAKMLQAEYFWALDPMNPSHVLTAMEEAIDVSDALDDADAASRMGEVAFWFGNRVLEANQAAKRPSKQIYVRARDLFVRLGAYQEAVQACRMALSLDQENADLLRELRDLETEATMQRGRYDEAQEAGEGGFRKSVKDADEQTKLHRDSIAASDRTRDEQIADARAAVEDNPDDPDLQMKLIRALLARETDASENEAIQILQKLHEQTGQYRYKIQIGDVRMKQFNRALRTLRKQLAEKPDDAEIRQKIQKVAAAQLKFELDEFTERARNYPTDMSIRYQLGRRQLATKNYDDAIASFQEAQGDPKYRAASLRYLGEAFFKKEWYDEAIDTFRRGIDAHGNAEDRLALELRYALMEALENKAQQEKSLDIAQEAQKIASQIAQTDINYRDVRQRVEALRKLVESLKNQG
jgi:tetratricopeptide (TPR) repeat protein